MYVTKPLVSHGSSACRRVRVRVRVGVRVNAHKLLTSSLAPGDSNRTASTCRAAPPIGGPIGLIAPPTRVRVQVHNDTMIRERVQDRVRNV